MATFRLDATDTPRFVTAAPPSRADLYVLAERVALRVMTWLRKRGYAEDDALGSNDTPERTFAEVLAQLATPERSSRPTHGCRARAPTRGEGARFLQRPI